MDAEAIIILAGLLWGGWVLMRIHKRRKETAEHPVDTILPKTPSDKDREMPRIGEPGSITFNQIQALRANSFTPDRKWSREEAALILDAVKYLRAVCGDVGDEEDGAPPVEIQNELLRFILTQQDLRDHVRKWGEDRRDAGLDEFSDDEPVLVQNNQYRRVEAEARKFMEPAEKTTEEP